MSANANISQNVDIPLYMTTLPAYQKNIMQKEGTVKFFNTEKGFGFISQSDDRSDVFVHSSGLIDEIRENDKVSFDIEDGKKGPNAVNVKVI
jgi:CspA family cold shock protein